jgi:hypothetical protein
MLSIRKHRRRLGGGAVLLTAIALLGPAASVSSAAAPTIVPGEVWASSVFSNSAHLQAKINPNGLLSSYHFDYITNAAYEANVAASQDPFTGASRTPPSDQTIGSGSSPVTVLQLLSRLTPDTTYRYRVVAKNTATSTGSTLTFATQNLETGSETCANAEARKQTNATGLPDCRAFEMVSPVDKNGGQVDSPGTLARGGVLQAAAGGGSVTYGSSASFGSGATGAPPSSQYIATRSAGGWSTQNITAPLFAGSFGTENDEGVPYRLFSGDLARGLLLNGRHCRGEGTDCAVPNPPLAGTDAPEGYQNFYLRESSSGALEALLGASNAGALKLEPANFDLTLAGAAPDLHHVVVSTCAALTSNATEVPLGPGCNPNKPNLYEYSPGAGLSLVNILPAQTQGTPGAALGAQSLAVSANGSRVYWSDLATGDLYLREGGETKLVDTGVFQTASADGSVAFYTKADEHLYRYDTATHSSTDLTPSGGVLGVLGASEDGAYVYYMTSSGVFMRHGATTTAVAAGADSSNYPPTTGTARVTADGTRLVFVATTPLAEYDNKDLHTGLLDSEVYLYDSAGSGTLTCVSCNPTFERPTGPSTIPGAFANGEGSEANYYKPRVLSADGRRVYFESLDAVGPADTNGKVDVYQWEAQGAGSCKRVGGCVSLMTSGLGEKNVTFVDASADGSDVFFLTDRSLVKADLPGSVDLYDARAGGGFEEPIAGTACDGDACRSIPEKPVDPTLTTLVEAPYNPKVTYPNRKECKKGYKKHKGRCVKKKGHNGGKKTSHKRSGR